MLELQGEFHGRSHVLALRIYYEDTDAAGIVYHSNYLKYAERARTEMMRQFGLDHTALAAKGVAFVVRRAEVEFLKPARLDDVVLVVTEVAALARASMAVRQTVRRAADSDALAVIDLKLACMALESGRAVRVPAELHDRLTSFLSEQRI